MHAGILCAICVLVGIASATALDTSTSIPGPDVPVLSSTAPRPPGYIYKPATGHYYKYHGERQSWDDARATCEREGAYLVELNNAVEARAVKEIVKDNVGDYYGAWIGLRDVRTNEGVMDWRTIHGKPISEAYHVWRSGRPTNEEYAACGGFVAYGRELVDEPCHIRRYFLCEISH